MSTFFSLICDNFFFAHTCIFCSLDYALERITGGFFWGVKGWLFIARNHKFLMKLKPTSWSSLTLCKNYHALGIVLKGRCSVWKEDILRWFLHACDAVLVSFLLSDLKIVFASSSTFMFNQQGTKTSLSWQTSPLSQNGKCIYFFLLWRLSKHLKLLLQTCMSQFTML